MPTYHGHNGDGQYPREYQRGMDIAPRLYLVLSSNICFLVDPHMRNNASRDQTTRPLYPVPVASTSSRVHNEASGSGSHARAAQPSQYGYLASTQQQNPAGGNGATVYQDDGYARGDRGSVPVYQDDGYAREDQGSVPTAHGHSRGHRSHGHKSSRR